MPLRRRVRPLSPALLAGFVAALLAGPVQGSSAALAAGTAPLSGVLRADGVPLAGVTLVVRGLSGAAVSVVKVLKTDSEGTFCLADARPGVYTILAAVPGFRSASAQVLHRATANTLSFVRLDLDRERRGVLPAGPGGALDPWAARAVVDGDVLRERGPSTPEERPERAPAPVGAVAPSVAASTAATFPLKGSVASLQGFGAEGGGALSQTSLDVRGTLGDGVRWGISGGYDRVMSAAGDRLGGAARVALDVLPGDGHSIRVSSRRNDITSFESPDARFDAHSVDWDATPGRSSQTSVSARILSHRNLEPARLVSPLFRHDGSALEVDARYRNDLGGGRFVRLQVGYRSGLDENSVAGSARPDREARFGGAAGVRFFDALLVEAGGTGDYTTASHGVAPELTLSLEALRGLTLYGFASRRWEQREPGVYAPGIVGIDPSDLVRATRALYRAGVRFDRPEGTQVELEASRREISEAFQLLLDSDVVDRIDALFLFPGDVADVASGAVTFAVKADVAARLALLAGRVEGDGATFGAIPNEARYWVSSARVDVRPSGTSVSLRYRRLEQELGGEGDTWFNGRESIDVTLAQEIPIPVLRAFGSRWQALFSIATGTRQDGDQEPRQNRRMAGGLALSF